MSLLTHTLIDFETSLERDLGGGVPAVEPVAPAAPAAPAAAEPQGWLPQSRDELEQIVAGTAANATRQVIAEALAQQQPPAYQEPHDPYAGYDPFDPRTVAALAATQSEQQIVDLLGPLADRVLPWVEQQEQAHGREMAKAATDQLKGELGEFNDQQAYARAVVLVQSGYAPDQALRQAASEVIAYEKELKAAGVAEQNAAFQAMQNQPRQPGTGQSAGAQVIPIPTGKNRYAEQMQRSMIERGMAPGLQTPAG